MSERTRGAGLALSGLVVVVVALGAMSAAQPAVVPDEPLTATAVDRLTVVPDRPLSHLMHALADETGALEVATMAAAVPGDPPSTFQLSGCPAQPLPATPTDHALLLTGSPYGSTTGTFATAPTAQCRPDVVTVTGTIGPLPSYGTFGGPDTTGVPPGTVLSAYTGPCTVTAANTVIQARLITCEPLVIRASGVVVRSSLVQGHVDIEDASASLLIEDSEVDGGDAGGASIGYRNLTVRRSEVRGGQHGVNCIGNCTVEDSWVHSQWVPDDRGWHLQPFLSNGATGVVLRRNTLSCTVGANPAGGGCTANVSIFGDFAPNADFLVEGNLFVASQANSYCAYGGSSPGKPYAEQVSGIRFLGNVFERGDNGRCGFYGAVTDFDPDRPGNEWSGNVWSDGTPITP